MKKRAIIPISFLLLMLMSGTSQAVFPTFDAVNAALSEIRNALVQSQFVQEIAVATQHLAQLKDTYFEMLRVNSGIDDLFQNTIGDPLKQMSGVQSRTASAAFSDFGALPARIEILEHSSTPQDIRNALEDITGEIPKSEERPYIPFEEVQVVDGFRLAGDIKKAGKVTRDAAEALRRDAMNASPKGAARLGVQAMSHILEVNQQNQEALAKLIELQATQVEQISREEKRYERERLRYMQEFQEGLESLGGMR